ncbi:LITAF-like zinc ribbon domain-containing protein [Auriculariales sp. MPI-PUGE-AT-0066]|nr:LITAF-like zinc ribbon domain-containing protein [Auriculariales sp. MPI-PUGE-AT-0066]
MSTDARKQSLPPSYGERAAATEQHVVIDVGGQCSSRPVVVMPVSDYQRVWNLRQHAAPCHCPNCGQTTLTTLEYKVERYTHLMAAVFATFLFCFLPYMSTPFKQVIHSCANCHTKLAIWHPEGHLELLVQDTVPGASQPTPVVAPPAEKQT